MMQEVKCKDLRIGGVYRMVWKTNNINQEDYIVKILGVSNAHFNQYYLKVIAKYCGNWSVESNGTVCWYVDTCTFYDLN